MDGWEDFCRRNTVSCSELKFVSWKLNTCLPQILLLLSACKYVNIREYATLTLAQMRVGDAMDVDE